MRTVRRFAGGSPMVRLVRKPDPTTVRKGVHGSRTSNGPPEDNDVAIDLDQLRGLQLVEVFPLFRPLAITSRMSVVRMHRLNERFTNRLCEPIGSRRPS